MTAVDLALELVRLDTVNPPGREAAAASLLSERLSRAGSDAPWATWARCWSPSRRRASPRTAPPRTWAATRSTRWRPRSPPSRR